MHGQNMNKKCIDIKHVVKTLMITNQIINNIVYTDRKNVESSLQKILFF